MNCVTTITTLCLLFACHQVEGASLSPSVRASSYKNNNIYKEANVATQKKIDDVRALVEKKGCEVNVCFTIDGSGSIKDKDFKVELNFVDLVANIISTDKPINFCAVQYSTITTAVSPLISNRVTFLNRVRTTKQDGGQTNLAAGLGYAVLQLFGKVDDANKIIVLGDGLSNLGFSPAFIGESFRDSGGSISALAVGSSSVTELAAVTGSPDLVFYVKQFAQLINELQNVVEKTCGIRM